jgi:hypothetical protein
MEEKGREKCKESGGHKASDCTSFSTQTIEKIKVKNKARVED